MSVYERPPVFRFDALPADVQTRMGKVFDKWDSTVQTYALHELQTQIQSGVDPVAAVSSVERIYAKHTFDDYYREDTIDVFIGMIEREAGRPVVTEARDRPGLDVEVHDDEVEYRHNQFADDVGRIKFDHSTCCLCNTSTVTLDTSDGSYCLLCIQTFHDLTKQYHQSRADSDLEQEMQDLSM